MKVHILLATVVVALMAASCGNKSKSEGTDPNNGTDPNDNFKELPTLYTEPFTSWGMTKDALMAQVGANSNYALLKDTTYIDDNSSTLVYISNEQVADEVHYNFDPQKTLFESIIWVAPPSSSSSEIKNFLSARYTDVSSYYPNDLAAGIIGVYTNSFTSPTLLVWFYPDPDYPELFRVIYISYDYLLNSASAPARSGGGPFSVKIPAHDGILRAFIPAPKK